MVDTFELKSYILNQKRKENMTDISKYRNVSLTHTTYNTLVRLSKSLLPDAKLSISKTVEALANEKDKKLNGKSHK